MPDKTQVLLGSVVQTVRRAIHPSEIDPQGPYVLMEHIAQRTGEVTPAWAKDFDIQSQKSSFQAEDILYGKLRPNLRKCCVATGAGACSTEIAPLRPLHADSSYYIAAVLRSEEFTARVQSLVAGANLPRVNIKEMLTLEIPWPSDSNALRRLNFMAREALELRGDIESLREDVALLEQFVTD